MFRAHATQLSSGEQLIHNLWPTKIGIFLIWGKKSFMLFEPEVQSVSQVQDQVDNKVLAATVSISDLRKVIVRIMGRERETNQWRNETIKFYFYFNWCGYKFKRHTLLDLLRLARDESN